MMVSNIRISDIGNRVNRSRKVKQSKVDELVINIAEVGLLNPITISNKNELIAGAHRLAAFEVIGEQFIPAHVIEFDLSDDDIRLMELSENAVSNDLKKTDRLDVFLEIRRLTDLRNENGGLNKKSETAEIQAVSLLSRKEIDKKSKQKKKTDALNAGFNGLSDVDSTIRIVNKGIPELQELYDSGEIKQHGAYSIAALPKEEQLDAISNYKKGIKVKKDEIIGTHQQNIASLKKQDKFGVYMDIRLYRGEPEKTAQNIAKQYGEAHIDAYRTMLVELSRQLSLMMSSNSLTVTPDDYSIFSYGLRNVSDGDFKEITNLLETGVIKKSVIYDEYSIGAGTLSRIIEIYKELENEG